jgi:hypothetical protein
MKKKDENSDYLKDFKVAGQEGSVEYAKRRKKKLHHATLSNK